MFTRYPKDYLFDFRRTEPEISEDELELPTWEEIEKNIINNMECQDD